MTETMAHAATQYRSVFRSDLFSGQTYLITGGGSGIGRCTAHELASLGAHVVLLGRRVEKLQQVAQEILEDGGQVSYFSCDIRNEEQVRGVIADIMQQRGQIHGLVNNAGGQFPSPLGMISTKGFEAVIRNNLTGTFVMMREVFQQSLQEHGGAIVNMTADFWGGMPGMGHSGAARAGVDNLTKTASIEWAPFGIRVNAVAPGWIMSSGMDTYQGVMKTIIPTLKTKVPLKRMGTESEVSAAICFLLSPASAFITGMTLRIDGAASLGSRIWELPEHQQSVPYDGFHRAFIPDVLKQEE